MTTTLVHVWVKPEFRDAFISATLENHEKSVKEPGNLRFDILQDASDSCKFVLYEAYISEEAAAEHKKTPHYFKWRDTVASWMEKDRRGDKHIMLAPIK